MPWLTIDKVTRYAANDATIVQVTPSVDLAVLSSGLGGATDSAALSLPTDPAVMQRMQAWRTACVA